MAEIAKNIVTIGDIEIHADLAGPDALDIEFIINGAPTVDDKAMGTLDFTLGVLLSGLGKQLEDNYRMTFKGTRQRDGLTITGDYTLSNLQALFP